MWSRKRYWKSSVINKENVWDFAFSTVIADDLALSGPKTSVAQSWPGARPTNNISIEFDKNLGCSGLKCAQPITTKFRTWHDSVTGILCANCKVCCNRPNMLWTKTLQSFSEFWIRLKYCQWKGGLVWVLYTCAYTRLVFERPSILINAF